MRVKFKNTKKLLVTKTFVWSALSFLDIAHEQDATITIKFVNTLDKGATDGNCSGDLDSVDICIATGGRPFLSQLRALSHELIHARQFLAGELSPELTCWKGEDFSETEYLEQPWEIEAHTYEDRLFMEAFPWHIDV